MLKYTLAAALAALTIAGTAGAQNTAAKPKSYHKDIPAALAKEAKVSEPDAATAALKGYPRGKIDKVELEKEDGKFIYSYDIKVSGKKGVEEVHVDAMTGQVVSAMHESPAMEKKEAAAEKAEKKDAKPKPKKP
jgi:uncharacterized membrane protein YkoI